MNFTKIDVTNSSAPTATIARIYSMCKGEWTFSLLTQIVWIPYIWATAVIGVVVVNAYAPLFIGGKRYPLDSHHQRSLRYYSFMTLVDAEGHPKIVPNLSGLSPNNNRSLVALHRRIAVIISHSCWQGDELHTQQNKLKTANLSRLI